jgi:hypothetical protein
MTKKGGWYGESRRHSLASRGVETGRKQNPNRTPKLVKRKGFDPGKESKAKYTKDNATALASSQELHLFVPLSKFTKGGDVSNKAIQKGFANRYGLDIGMDPDADDEYEMLFYNPDMRSQCGMIMDWSDELGIVLWPRYWAGKWGSDSAPFELDDSHYGDNFQKLINDATEVVIAKNEKGVYTGKSFF